MAVPPEQSCAKCTYLDAAGIQRFYERAVAALDGTPLGWCRQDSPKPRVRDSGDVYPESRRSQVLGVEWPEVRMDDWCGNFKLSPPLE